MSNVVFADRSDRGKLRVGDEQRAWFLDQILTQSIQDMQPGEARDAALLTVHGRMQAYAEVLATPDNLLLHYESDLREFLPDALRAYVFATRVTLEDVTDELGLMLVVGEEWENVASQVEEAVALHPTLSLGVPAGYIWADHNDVQTVRAKLDEQGAASATEDELETIRIDNAVARWGKEMDTKTFPQEAGVDERAVHYEKGCYLGQEAMAKIHFRGKVNRKLVLLRGSGPLTPGTEIVHEDKKIGAVTSASNGRALALVRYDVDAGTNVVVGEVSATIQTRPEP